MQARQGPRADIPVALVLHAGNPDPADRHSAAGGQRRGPPRRQPRRPRTRIGRVQHRVGREIERPGVLVGRIQVPGPAQIALENEHARPRAVAQAGRFRHRGKLLSKRTDQVILVQLAGVQVGQQAREIIFRGLQEFPVARDRLDQHHSAAFDQPPDRRVQIRRELTLAAAGNIEHRRILNRIGERRGRDRLPGCQPVRLMRHPACEVLRVEAILVRHRQLVDQHHRLAMRQRQQGKTGGDDLRANRRICGFLALDEASGIPASVGALAGGNEGWNLAIPRPAPNGPLAGRQRRADETKEIIVVPVGSVAVEAGRPRNVAIHGAMVANVLEGLVDDRLVLQAHRLAWLFVGGVHGRDSRREDLHRGHAGGGHGKVAAVPQAGASLGAW